MVTAMPRIVCPVCKSINDYAIDNLSLVDIDLHASLICNQCKSRYTDIYALVYLGGYTDTISYDRDNISV